jgi:hypothetical protein
MKEDVKSAIIFFVGLGIMLIGYLPMKDYLNAINSGLIAGVGSNMFLIGITLEIIGIVMIIIGFRKWPKS